MVNINSWGRLFSAPHQLHTPSDPTQLANLMAQQQPGLAYGMGRSYGDACLNPNGHLWVTTGLGRFISFDVQTGRLVCDAGVLLRDIQRLFIPRGWMLPVTPGTQLVTVGGAIANDVHGKNHHRAGSFAEHVRQLVLQRSNGETIICGPQQQADWFAATVGGIGLTGVIVRAELQLRPVSSAWIRCETIPYHNLDEFFQLADESEQDWEYTVSWIDCLSSGRGIFMRGNHSEASHAVMPAAAPRRVPCVPPISLVNHATLWSFNQLYFNMKKWQSGIADMHYRPFFYPLDNLADWNRIYGPRGFYQYQSVVPRAAGKDAVAAMLHEIARSGAGSFLAVLKTFGIKQSCGMLSFPQHGVTLALDFANQGADTLQLFERLDNIVLQAGGRLYLAKDARMSSTCFAAGYSRLNEFLPYRDPCISSAMARRLMG